MQVFMPVQLKKGRMKQDEERMGASILLDVPNLGGNAPAQTGDFESFLFTNIM
jgi:hypothetical protein